MEDDTTRSLTAGQIATAINAVDDAFETWIWKDRASAVRDFLDWCRRETMDGGILGVYYIGDIGWVSEDEWDEVFSTQPEWARDAYMIEANSDATLGAIADRYNAGGLAALDAWVERIDDDGDLNTVFWTSYYDDELEDEWAEELADLRRQEPAPGNGAAPPSPSPDMTGSGIGI